MRNLTKIVEEHYMTKNGDLKDEIVHYKCAVEDKNKEICDLKLELDLLNSQLHFHSNVVKNISSEKNSLAKKLKIALQELKQTNRENDTLVATF